MSFNKNNIFNFEKQNSKFSLLWRYNRQKWSDNFKKYKYYHAVDPKLVKDKKISNKIKTKFS